MARKWCLMVKRILLFITVVLFLSGCLGSPTIPLARDRALSEDGDMFIDKTYGFQVSKPGKNWGFGDNWGRSHGIFTYLIVVVPKRDLWQYEAEFHVSVYNQPVESLEDYINKVNLSWKPAKIEIRKFAGEPAHFWTTAIELQNKEKGTRIMSKNVEETYQFVHGKYGYLVEIKYNRQRFQEFRGLADDLDFIIKSFKFTQ